MRNGGHDNSLDGRANGSVAHDGERLRTLLQHVMADLRSGGARQAARRLIAAQEAAPLPADFPIIPQLSRLVGSGPTTELLLRLATFPCFYCHGGLLSCELCGGRGHLGDGLPCERCIGLGCSRCDFCGGSGWTGVNAMPPSVRPLVILQRVRLALRGSRKFLAQPSLEVQATDDREARRQAAREVVATERQRAILDEAISTAERSGLNSRIGAELAKLLPQCAEYVPRVEDRLRAGVASLASVARRVVDRHPADSSQHHRGRARTEYYEALAHSDDFGGSGLERPQLRRSVQRIGQRSDVPADDSGDPHVN